MADMKELRMDEMEQISGGADLGDEKPKKWVIYHVVEGDKIRKIAARYMCTVNELKSWNNLTSDTLYAGMSLNIYTINY